jgi:septum formation protein
MLILASTSKYRIKQLQDFGFKFKAVKPDFNEETFKKKSLNPESLCRLLAQKKAESLKIKFPKAVIIGADQLVDFRGEVLGKPLTFKKAFQTLKKMSGKTHRLITAVCVVNAKKTYVRTNIATIHMRKLTDQEIRSYLKKDQPLDCAGSYKFEKAGLSLMKKVNVTDPSALIGLPLIDLADMLRLIEK